MAKFIPINKIKQLREASRNGDERAKNILDLHMNGEDYSSIFEEYFNPKQPEHVEEKPNLESQEQTGLQKFLAFNNVKEGSPEFNDYVEEYYMENPEEKPKSVKEEVIDTLAEGKVEKIDKMLVSLSRQDSAKENLDEGQIGLRMEYIDTLIEDENEAIQGYDKGILLFANIEEDKNVISVLNEIKTDELRHIKMLKDLFELYKK